MRLLSGGNQQKVVLGKWLAGDVRIFIFDEPTRGIDVGAKVEIYNLMNRLTARGAGIIMISSELPELLGMSDRILVMHRGRIQAEIDAADATEERVLRGGAGTGELIAARQFGTLIGLAGALRWCCGSSRRTSSPSRTCSTSPSRPASTPSSPSG